VAWIVTRVLLSRTDGRDRGEDQYYYQSLPELVGYFLRVRNGLGDFIPAATVVLVPDDPFDDQQPDEVSEGADIMTEEGGYRWHTDGRGPEAVA
jgi:hypothetical protein